MALDANDRYTAVLTDSELRIYDTARREQIAYYEVTGGLEEILREKPHTLSEKEEEILAAVSDLTSVPENAYDMLSYADMDFPKIENEDGEMVDVYKRQGKSRRYSNSNRKSTWS